MCEFLEYKRNKILRFGIRKVIIRIILEIIFLLIVKNFSSKSIGLILIVRLLPFLIVFAVVAFILALLIKMFIRVSP